MSPKRATPTAAPQPSPELPLLPDGVIVFLVDEDDAVRDALALSLRAAGHTVAAFGSARELLAAYRRDSRDGPGCLVADVDLADASALELLRTLAVAQPALPAILTSRRLKRRAAVAGPPPGRVLFLDKPFGIEELLAAIRTVLASAIGS